ncbi:hypothetical protein C8Q76DRAFT_225343 [Earliella scabrosa]|nr:hypothetical protein C8Q76DRAFT_225343 [Earliella scabrosa]
MTFHVFTCTGVRCSHLPFEPETPPSAGRQHMISRPTSVNQSSSGCAAHSNCSVCPNAVTALVSVYPNDLSALVTVKDKYLSALRVR